MPKNKLEFPEIRSSLILSTIHLKESLALDVDNNGEEAFDRTRLEPVRYGYQIWSGYCEEKRLPKSLRKILKYATDLGCCYVVFDNDGPKMERFKTHDW